MIDNFSTVDKKKFKIAQEFSRKGDLKNTVKLLRELVHDNPRSGIMNAMLANTYWDLGNTEAAEKFLKIAVKLSPSSEKISLGLFHVLWDQNKKDEALDEAKRYTAISDSEEYQNIIDAINK